jgi:hypothetical protein
MITNPMTEQLLQSIDLTLREIATSLADIAKAAQSRPQASQPANRVDYEHTGGTSNWRSYQIKGGKLAGKTLGELADALDRDGVTSRLQWWIDNYQPRMRNDGTPWPDNVELRNMLDAAKAELGGQKAAGYAPKLPTTTAPRPKPQAEQPIDDEDIPF